MADAAPERTPARPARTLAEVARLGFENEPLHDYPMSPLFRAYFAERGETAPLPEGYPEEAPQRFDPLPILPYNETEWLRDQAEIAALLNIAVNGLPPLEEPPALPAMVKPMAPPSPPEPDQPAAKLRGRWRHV